jgi:hypothetical protein
VDRLANPTPATWAATLLKRLGIDQTPGAVRALVGWAKAEGGHWNNKARYNPLNTTQNMPGAGNTGSQGNIKVYKSWDQGIDATVKTLENGRYGTILKALQSGNAGAVADAIGGTPWGTSGALVRQTIAGTPNVSGARPFGTSSPSATPTGGTGATSTTTTVTDPSQSVVAALDKLPLPEKKQPPQTAITPPSFAAKPILSSVIQTTAPEKKASVLDSLNTLAKIQEPQTTTTTTTSDDGGAPAPAPATSGGGGKLPSGTANFEGKQVAAWIKPALVYARKQGWKGQVNSGYRSFEEQTRIYNSGVRPAAKPGTSNHEGSDFPRGAVDVSDAAQLSSILRASPWARKLVYAGTKDPVHFSHPHGGSY